MITSDLDWPAPGGRTMLSRYEPWAFPARDEHFLVGKISSNALRKTLRYVCHLTSKSIRIAVATNRNASVAVNIHGTMCFLTDTRVSTRPWRRAPFGSQTSRREGLLALGFASRPHDRFALSRMRRRQAPADCAALPGTIRKRTVARMKLRQTGPSVRPAANTRPDTRQTPNDRRGPAP